MTGLFVAIWLIAAAYCSFTAATYKFKSMAAESEERKVQFQKLYTKYQKACLIAVFAPLVVIVIIFVVR